MKIRHDSCDFPLCKLTLLNQLLSLLPEPWGLHADMLERDRSRVWVITADIYWTFSLCLTLVAICFICIITFNRPNNSEGRYYYPHFTHEKNWDSGKLATVPKEWQARICTQGFLYPMLALLTTLPLTPLFNFCNFLSVAAFELQIQIFFNSHCFKTPSKILNY